MLNYVRAARAIPNSKTIDIGIETVLYKIENPPKDHDQFPEVEVG